jgi:hypothetical protein
MKDEMKDEMKEKEEMRCLGKLLKGAIHASERDKK